MSGRASLLMSEFVDYKLSAQTAVPQLEEQPKDYV